MCKMVTAVRGLYNELIGRPHCYPTPSQIRTPGSTLLALVLEGGKDALVMMAIGVSPPSDRRFFYIFVTRTVHTVML